MTLEQRPVEHGANRPEVAPPEGFRWVGEGLNCVDSEPYVAILEERFGIPRAHFDDLLVFKPNRAWLSIVRRDLLVPTMPKAAGVGMPFFYPDLVHPRPTTSTTIRFGVYAKKNILDLDRLSPADDPTAAIQDFVHRRPIVLDAKARAHLESPGYVIVRHLGLVAGLAHCKVVDDEWRLTGMAPKTWDTLARVGDRRPTRAEPL